MKENSQTEIDLAAQSIHFSAEMTKYAYFLQQKYTLFKKKNILV